MKIPRPALLAATVGVAMATAIAISGCSGTPDPAPSETPLFSNEEEAFAAAEETYRAYVDALNRVDLSDPATFEDVFAWTTGEANAGERETFSRMHADDWSVSGTTAFDSFVQARGAVPIEGIVAANVCLDVTGVDVTDSGGRSVVPEDRRERQPVTVVFVESSTSTRLAISQSDATLDFTCSK